MTCVRYTNRHRENEKQNIQLHAAQVPDLISELQGRADFYLQQMRPPRLLYFATFIKNRYVESSPFDVAIDYSLHPTLKYSVYAFCLDLSSPPEPVVGRPMKILKES